MGSFIRPQDLCWGQKRPQDLFNVIDYFLDRGPDSDTVVVIVRDTLLFLSNRYWLKSTEATKMQSRSPIKGGLRDLL